MIKIISRRFYLGFVAAMMAISFLATPAVAAEDPVALLQGIADKLINELKTNQATLKNNSQLVYSLADKIVVPEADIDGMAKRVLPPRIWQQATPAQQAEFKSEFTTLLVRTYASALAEFTDQTIKFHPVRGGFQGKSEVQVNSTIIRTDGPAIDVNYRLTLKNAQWKLCDLVVEGVSMLESFRSQFADELIKGDMVSLIARLKAHNSTNNVE